MQRQLVIIAHNLRSTHNVGSLLRTADGLGVKSVYLTGYTPFPQSQNDERLPHVSQKITRQIHKTALGAEKFIAWEHFTDIDTAIEQLRAEGFMIAALEQAADAISLPQLTVPSHLAIIIGREVEGIETEVLKRADIILSIPMLGKKESFNVVQAAAMALYHCRFAP